MSIDPEKLLALAKQRQSGGCVYLGWPMVVSIVEELRELQRLRNVDPDAVRQQLAERVTELESERDARMKVEALEELINQTSQYKEANPVRGLAGHMVERLHRQAEEGQSCSSTSPSASPLVSC